MQGKISVQICVGTTCYLMGASDILTIGEELEHAFKGRVEITRVPCLDLCRSREHGGAPFVTINGTILSRATVHSVREHIRQLLQEK
jgi:NADH:ubiquinone oxidoreductase subunit E